MSIHGKLDQHILLAARRACHVPVSALEYEPGPCSTAPRRPRALDVDRLAAHVERLNLRAGIRRCFGHDGAAVDERDCASQSRLNEAEQLTLDILDYLARQP